VGSLEEKIKKRIYDLIGESLRQFAGSEYGGGGGVRNFLAVEDERTALVGEVEKKTSFTLAKDLSGGKKVSFLGKGENKLQRPWKDEGHQGTMDFLKRVRPR